MADTLTITPGATQIEELAAATRGETTVETGLTYDGLRPVPVRISKREGRYKVTDDGAAVSAAGVGHRRVAYPDHIELAKHSVNVSRRGVVWLPAVAPSEAWLTKVCSLVAEGSVGLYERLLELDSATRREA